MRELEKKIGKILRKSARQYATDGYFAKTEIKPGDLYEFLGAPEYTRDKYQGNEYAGVVTGLAWTAVGGEILFVETSLSRGKGGRLTLTGNLGDVMKESAMLALEYIKAHASLLNLDEEILITGTSMSMCPKAPFRKTVRLPVSRWLPPSLLPSPRKGEGQSCHDGRDNTSR